MAGNGNADALQSGAISEAQQRQLETLVQRLDQALGRDANEDKSGNGNEDSSPSA